MFCSNELAIVYVLYSWITFTLCVDQKVILQIYNKNKAKAISAKLLV